MKENWRTIPDWPKYEVSDLGRVRRAATGRVLTPNATKSGKAVGYRPLYVHLSINEHVHPKFKVAVLVLRAFVGERPPGLIALHQDDNQTNNKLTNLRWGTHKHNGEDRVINGKSNSGASNGNSRLTEQQVLEIRSLYVYRSKTHGTLPLAKMFGVSGGTINNIINRVIWDHI